MRQREKTRGDRAAARSTSHHHLCTFDLQRIWVHECVYTHVDIGEGMPSVTTLQKHNRLDEQVQIIIHPYVLILSFLFWGTFSLQNVFLIHLFSCNFVVFMLFLKRS